jgi:hypothetical protein
MSVIFSVEVMMESTFWAAVIYTISAMERSAGSGSVMPLSVAVSPRLPKNRQRLDCVAIAE